MLTQIPTILVGKFARLIVRLKGGHGSALPGYLIEKIDPNFLRKALSTLEMGVIVITGTNGKTTTSRMLVELLQGQGLRVLTNPSGSNLTRGLISTVIENITMSGKLPFDIAVFEIDEAYSPKFASQVSPRLLVALNVMRDQLDRYGELETTANYIKDASNKSQQTIVNANDSLLVEKLNQPHTSFFGADDKISSLISNEASISRSKSDSDYIKSFVAKATSLEVADSYQDFHIQLGKELLKIRLPLLGVHNVLNSSAAIGAAKLILGDKLNLLKAEEALNQLSPAFGRGETLRVGDKEFTVALVKNPSGFTQNLKTYANQKFINNIVITINDNYADGRDVSWLWDVDLSSLKDFSGKIYVGGSRRFDMAICLKYQNIKCIVIDTPNPEKMMDELLSKSDGSHTLIVPTYTAMLAIRKYFGKLMGVKKIW